MSIVAFEEPQLVDCGAHKLKISSSFRRLNKHQHLWRRCCHRRSTPCRSPVYRTQLLWPPACAKSQQGWLQWASPQPRCQLYTLQPNALLLVWNWNTWWLILQDPMSILQKTDWTNYSSFLVDNGRIWSGLAWKKVLPMGLITRAQSTTIFLREAILA